MIPRNSAVIAEDEPRAACSASSLNNFCTHLFFAFYLLLDDRSGKRLAVALSVTISEVSFLPAVLNQVLFIPLSLVADLAYSTDQRVTVSELCAALRVSGAAAHMVNVIRSVGEGRAAAVTRA